MSLTDNSTCEFDPLHDDLHLAILRRELDGVAQQVPHDLLQAAGVPGHRAGDGVDDLLQLDPLRLGGGVRPTRSAASITAGRSTRCTSSRIFPEMMRLMSRRSSMSFAWMRELRMMMSSPSTKSSSLRLARLENLRPAEDGVERRADFVREVGEELVLDPAQPLRLRPPPLGRLERQPFSHLRLFEFLDGPGAGQVGRGNRQVILNRREVPWASCSCFWASCSFACDDANAARSCSSSAAEFGMAFYLTQHTHCGRYPMTYSAFMVRHQFAYPVDEDVETDRGLHDKVLRSQPFCFDHRFVVASAEYINTFTDLNSSCSLIVRRTVRPSISGMFTSRIINAGLRTWSIANASAPPVTDTAS